MANTPQQDLLQLIIGIWMLKWFLRIFAVLILFVFAILATPFWLVFRTKFNPWSVVLKPLSKSSHKKFVKKASAEESALKRNQLLKELK